LILSGVLRRVVEGGNAVSHLLSFSASANGEEIEVHMSPEGLDVLLKNLSQLGAAASSGTNEHVHLMSAKWGGWELECAQPKNESSPADMVSLYLWHGKIDKGS